MSSVAIIPARGGSKRLPRKNIIDFLGRPIIAYTIDAADESGCFERVVVSTDDDEIAEVARRCGAEVDRRRPELATRSNGLSRFASIFSISKERERAAIGCISPASMRRRRCETRKTFARRWHSLEPGRCDFAMAVTAYDHYAHQALKFEADAALTPMWPDLVERRGSDLPPLRAGNGSTYAVNEVGAFATTLVLRAWPAGPRHAARSFGRHRHADDLDFAIGSLAGAADGSGAQMTGVARPWSRLSITDSPTSSPW